MTESPAEPRPTAKGPSQPHPIVDAARAIAAALLPLTNQPSLQREVIVTVARTLREAVARERDTEPHTVPPSPILRRTRALAQAIGALPPSDEPAVLVADLRLFARLTLSECADLLNCPRDMLARTWRSTRRAVFESARQTLASPDDVPPLSPDS